MKPAAKPTWYHVVRRLADGTQFDGERHVVLQAEHVMGACRAAQDPALARLEKEMMSRVGRFCLATKRIAAVDFARDDKEGLHMVLGQSLDAMTGAEEDRAALLYAWRVVQARRGLAKSQDDSSAAVPKIPFPVPPSLAALFNAVSILLNQRIVLAR